MNFAQFSWDSQTPGAFNNAIEGGIRVTFTLDRNFAVGFTVERLNMRAVNPGVCDLLDETADYRHCEAIEIDADDDAATPETQLESLDVSDDNYFRDEPTTTLSVKFIFFVS